MRFIPLILAPVFLMAGLPAQAQGTAAKAKPADADARLMAEFKATDGNGDGKLSRAEVDVRVKRMAAGSKQFTPATAKTLTDRYFTIADANGDGSVSPAEWRGLTRALANRYDANHDGVVSIQERQAARAAAMAEAKGK